jgi:hypothetical protein
MAVPVIPTSLTLQSFVGKHGENAAVMAGGRSAHLSPANPIRPLAPAVSAH